MKLYILAAAALVAAPALAQTDTTQQTTPDTTQTAPADPSATPMQSDPNAAPAPAAGADQSMGQPAPAAPMASTPTPPPADGSDPTGGYQPSAPPLSGTPAPGQTVQFVPAPSPDQAYPAPAPMKSYPICKKGQYDNCRQAHDPK